ncbi:MAG: flavodoxin [Treponema sp.]|jgi:flavodoxin|nr:flavodoxin [Treponema sp.]
MKTAVVYYTLDGNCALVAGEIKAQLNADSIRLHTKDERKRGKIRKMFWGVGMVFSRKNPPLKLYSFDPSAYDLIIIGAPVWASSPAPPVKTFISEAGITGKKIAIFVCHAGGKGNALEIFKTLLAGNDIAAEADFNSPAKFNSEELKQQVADWLKGLQS